MLDNSIMLGNAHVKTPYPEAQETLHEPLDEKKPALEICEVFPKKIPQELESSYLPCFNGSQVSSSYILGSLLRTMNQDRFWCTGWKLNT